MKKRVIKLIFSIMLISALMIGFCSAYAHAATPTWLLRAKSGVLAAMLASQLVLDPINVLLDSPLTQSIDPLNEIPWVETLPEYLDRSVIKIVEDTVVIDGVYYSDVWLGPDAAQALRLQGLDFATAYDILSNQTDAITYARGVGYVNDVPMYDIGETHYRSPSYNVTFPYPTSSSYVLGDAYSVGNFNFNTASRLSSQIPYAFVTFNGTNFTSTGYQGDSFSTHGYVFVGYKGNGYRLLSGSPNNSNLSNTYPLDSSPFSFDYTSGIIDAPLAEDDGLLIRIPSSYDDPSTGSTVYDIHDIVINFPGVTQDGGREINIDPSLNPDFQTDIDLGNGIGDLLLTIFGLDLLNKIINFAPEPVSPEPGPQPGVIDPLPDPDPAPDDPIPGTTIADTDWTKLDEILRWIQSTIDSIRHLTESLQTMLDSIFDAIQSAIQHIAEIPEAIRELADKILEDIELGPSKLFDKALDILKTLFLPLLIPIRAMMNLWHYVVEWIQSITTPFTWIFGIMSGTSGNMVLPIYALLAGGICISIYKALGR